MREFNGYLEEHRERDVELIGHLENKLPYRMFRHKFKGIQGLRSYKSKNEKASIQVGLGKTHFILFAENNDISEIHIGSFIEIASKYPEKTHLHIIVLDWTYPCFIQGLLGCPFVSVYRSNIATNPDLRVAHILSTFHVIIIDSEGMVIENAKFNNYSALNRIVNRTKPTLRGLPLSVGLADALINFPKNPLAEKIADQSKKWDYPAILELFFYTESSKESEEKVYGAKFNAFVREEHKVLIEPLLSLVEKEAQINSGYIKTF